MWCRCCDERHVLELPQNLRRAKRVMRTQSPTYPAARQKMQLRDVRTKGQQRRELVRAWRNSARGKNVQFRTVAFKESRRLPDCVDVEDQLAQTGQPAKVVVSGHSVLEAVAMAYPIEPKSRNMLGPASTTLKYSSCVSATWCALSSSTPCPPLMVKCLK